MSEANTKASVQYAPEESQPSPVTKRKPLWLWITPALWLWGLLLLINGIIGLSAHFLDISSPYYHLFIEVSAAVLIIVSCFKIGDQILPMLRGFGYRGSRLFELVAGLAFIAVFMWIYLKVMSLIGLEKISYLSDFTKHGWPLWSALVLISIFPAVFEELAFRGCIMVRMEKVGSAFEALVIQAAMFSVLHMLPTAFISHFIIGLTLGIIRLRSQSLYPGMLVHAVWNAIVVLGEAID